MLLVVYSSEYVRADVENTLENYLFDIGQVATHIKSKNGNVNDVVSYLRDFKNSADTVFFIDGLGQERAIESNIHASLNLQREFFTEKRIRVIFWLTQNEIIHLIRYVPDFWIYRDYIIEFCESPKPERILQGTLEFAWQGIGEYADQYEVNEVGISLRESQLTELPLDEEACSTRAHLLLALGVLNWRKGDYEKADEQLSEVLKIAAKLQDNWFQAQCFNAIALVKTSMERIGDAIDAYKQAIRLAPKQIFAWNNLGNLCSKIGRDDEAIIAFLKALECNSKDPIAWNGLGNVYYKKSYTDDAIAAFRKSIHFMPTFSHPWNGLGDVYAGSGRLNEAIQAYKQAIELNKVYITPWLNLGALFTKQGKYREAINAYDAALKLDSRNVAIWNDLGNVHLKCESYDEAISAFTKAAEIDHTNGRAYSNLALTYFQKGRYEQAVPLYLKSLEILKEDKDKANSWNRLADIYRLLNKYDLAIDAYRKADMLEWGIMQEERTDDGSKRPAIAAPTPGINLKVAAEINELVKDLDILQDTVKPAIGLQKEIDAEMVAHNIAGAPAWILNPKSEESCIDISQVQLINPVTQETKGDVVIKQKLFDLHHNKDNITMNQTAHVESVEHHAANNTNAIAWNEKGNFYFKRGALNDAINAYNKAIQFDPSFGWPYSNLALTYLAQGQNAESILLYQKSLDLLNSDKDKAVSWNGLGNAYRRINDYPNAVAAYQKAAKLDPETAGMRDGTDNFRAEQQPRSVEAWNDLGELFFETGAYDEAIRAFNKAIELEPNNGWSYCNLARLLVTQGRYMDAIGLYNKSVSLLQGNKDKAIALNHLGNAYRKLNDYDNAIKAYQKAVTLADEGVSLATRARFSLLSNCYHNQ